MDPELQEALSDQHANDTFCIRFLSTGRMAVYGREFVGFAETVEDLQRLAPLAVFKIEARERNAPVKTNLLNVEIEL